MKEVVTAPVLATLGPAYLQHEGPEWNAFHRLQYHMQLISIDEQLIDALSCASGDFLTGVVATQAD